MSDLAKWELFHLLKVLDSIHDGQHHDAFASVAQGLGLELPAMAPLPDQGPRVEHGAGSDGEAEADGEVAESEQERVLQFLATQAGPVALNQIIATLDIKKWTATSALYRLQRKGNVEHVGRDAWQVRSAG